MTESLIVGIDPGRYGHGVVVLGVDGEEVLRERVANEAAAIEVLVDRVVGLAGGAGRALWVIEADGGDGAVLIGELLGSRRARRDAHADRGGRPPQGPPPGPQERPHRRGAVRPDRTRGAGDAAATRRRTRDGRRDPRARAVPGRPHPRSDPAHQPAALPAQPVLARVPRGPRVRGARWRRGDGAAGRAPDAECRAVRRRPSSWRASWPPAIPASTARAGGAAPRRGPGRDTASGGGVRPARRRGRRRARGRSSRGSRRSTRRSATVSCSSPRRRSS